MNTQRIEQNGFRLLEQVDNTSRTTIWKAVQTTLDRTVIVQVLKSHVSEDPDEVNHFLTTARLFARVKSDAIAAVFDIVSDADLHYVVMEHVDGPTIEELVHQHGPVPPEKALRIAAALVTSLSQMWSSAHIVHRNLKSTTIRLDSRGVAKITDFSLAIVAGPGVDATARDNGNVVGTPCFLSPEQAQGTHTLTTQSDMYALGTVLYHLTTGIVPFESSDVYAILTAHVKEQIPPPHRVNKKIPVAFSWFLHRLMMKNPNNRYAEWDDVLHDIRLLLGGQQPSCVTPDETCLSTIASDFDTSAQPASDAEPTQIRLNRRGKKSHKLAAYQSQQLAHEQAEEQRRNNDLTRAAVCWGVLACWLMLVFWFRAVYQAESPSSAAALAANLDQAADASVNIRVGADAPETEAPKAPAAVPAPAPHPVTPPAPAPKPVATAAPSRPAPKEEPAEPPVAAEAPASLLAGLAQAFADGNIKAAQLLVRNAPEKFQTREALQSLLDQAPEPDALVADFLRANIGKPLAFEHNGKQRIVIPRSVSADAVQLEANGRGAELPFGKLTPDEKLRWMTPPADAPRALAYCLVLMRSSRRDELHARAAACPLVSEALSQALERAPAVTAPAE